MKNNKKILAILAILTALAGGSYGYKDEISCVGKDVKIDISKDIMWCGNNDEYTKLKEEFLSKLSSMNEEDIKTFNVLMQRDDFKSELKTKLLDKFSDDYDQKETSYYNYFIQTDTDFNTTLKTKLLNEFDNNYDDLKTNYYNYFIQTDADFNTTLKTKLLNEFDNNYDYLKTNYYRYYYKDKVFRDNLKKELKKTENKIKEKYDNKENKANIKQAMDGEITKYIMFELMDSNGTVTEESIKLKLGTDEFFIETEKGTRLVLDDTTIDPILYKLINNK